MILEESVRTKVLDVGRAPAAGALTTAGVYGILGLSNVVFPRHLGWMTAVGLLAAPIGSILVLPSLLIIRQKISGRKRAGEVCEVEAK
ncbi:MAG: hypothetical protein AB1384_05575 [Actinomycetota bacterium]